MSSAQAAQAAQAQVITFVPLLHSHLVPYLAAIHASCITHDRTIATFLPPLSHDKLLTWWKQRIAEIADGTRIIYLLLREPDPAAAITTAVAGPEPRGPDLVGVVMLHMPYSETGSFRGVVEKLLVHKSYRGQGGARVLMGALEREASILGRTMLTLDTETGSPAETVYAKLGYIEMGKIPKYGMSPTGELKDGTFFYKQL